MTYKQETFRRDIVEDRLEEVGEKIVTLYNESQEISRWLLEGRENERYSGRQLIGNDEEWKKSSYEMDRFKSELNSETLI